ncbi:glycosyltransferase family 4 protein [Halobacillus amylolyticus]|uniref:Glycosyltransferase family 4 protein n=1 Tax=Halobacillus amylolyticus TaxID=2932259 RepID=A0ABY4HBJ7_9BACI|nr:glycosyltransferase family 4 protein [Halobacillus amylolyticus]UOR11310.1 glycosyltransferase family 4 protein [Halobacillus amylolyticus]
MKKHILVISQYFYPEQFRINDICIEWIKRGYKVTVITGIPNYPEGRYYLDYGVFKKRKEVYNGIEIVRLPLIPRGNNSVMLALNYFSFVVSGLFWNLFTKLDPDYVFIFEVSPMSQALPGVWHAKKRNIPCFLYVQDLWPENVEIITGIKNKFIINSIGKMVDYIYKRTTKIFTTSNSFIKAIENRGVPKQKIEYWPQYAEGFYQPLSNCYVDEIPLDDMFNITFAGNIGYAQGLDILPHVAKRIQENYKNNNVRFNIIGGGRYKSDLEELVFQMEVDNMFNFIPKQKPEKIPEFLSVSDAAFLCLTESKLFEMTIPAKLQTYMACGMPIIGSADGETSNIIKSSGAGVCSPTGDIENLAENIIYLSRIGKDELIQIGSKSKKYYDFHFNKDNLLESMDQHFMLNH